MLNSLFGRMILLISAIIFVVLQMRLWLGSGGVWDNQQLQQQIDQQTAYNAKLKDRNHILAAEVYDLKNGLDAVEEHARLDLDMVKQGETFFRITKGSQPTAPSSVVTEASH